MAVMGASYLIIRSFKQQSYYDLAFLSSSLLKDIDEFYPKNLPLRENLPKGSQNSPYLLSPLALRARGIQLKEFKQLLQPKRFILSSRMIENTGGR